MDSGTKCYVYWIHRPSDSDIKNQGYVGITTNPQKRFKAHLKQMGRESSKNHKLYNSMRKHKDYLFDILLVSSREYCYMIEHSLRPNKNIGLNHASGGLLISDERLGYEFKTSTKEKISKGVKNAYLNDPSIVERQALAKRGRKLHENHADKLRSILRKIHKSNWENSNANHAFWLLAEEMHKVFCLDKSISYYKLGKMFGFGHTTAKTILEKFREGWNPSEDTKYLIYKELNRANYP